MIHEYAANCLSYSFFFNNLPNLGPTTSPATPLLFLLVKFYEITS